MTDLWSIGEAIEYVDDVAPEDATASAFSDGSLRIVWEGANRLRIWKTLANHGWVVTSVGALGSRRNHTELYLEQAGAGVYPRTDSSEI